MALFRPAFAILLALFGSTADAGSQAVPRKYQGDRQKSGRVRHKLADAFASQVPRRGLSGLGLSDDQTEESLSGNARRVFKL
jgi:hypothetical protein